MDAAEKTAASVSDCASGTTTLVPPNRRRHSEDRMARPRLPAVAPSPEGGRTWRREGTKLAPLLVARATTVQRGSRAEGYPSNSTLRQVTGEESTIEVVVCP